jgi:hypothetical protein
MCLCVLGHCRSLQADDFASFVRRVKLGSTRALETFADGEGLPDGVEKRLADGGVHIENPVF